MNEPRDEQRLPTKHVGRRLLHYGLTDSTNARALELARDPANEGVAVVADEQMAGRGRLGRSWQAPPGSSVLLSVVLFPPERIRQPAILTAWAAVAVCRLVKEVTGKEGQIKWPNDVLKGGKKVAGILLEQATHASAHPPGGPRGPPARAVVAGIGVNCTQTEADFAKAGLPDATSLIEDAVAYPLPPLVMGCLLRLLDQEYDRLLTGDPGTLEADWRNYIGLVGQEVEVEASASPTQTEVLRGRLRRLRFSGLELEHPDGAITRLEPPRVQHLRQATDEPGKR